MMSILEFGQLLHGLSREQVAETLESLAFGPGSGRKVASLSRGERQFLFLGFTLRQDADLIILDEPTASLDMRRRRQAQQLIEDRVGVKDGATVLLSSQLPEVLHRCCQYLIALRKGVVTYCGPIHTLPGYQHDPTGFEAALLAAIGM